VFDRFWHFILKNNFQRRFDWPLSSPSQVYLS